MNVFEVNGRFVVTLSRDLLMRNIHIFVHEKISDVFVITWIRKLRFYKLVSLLFVNLRAFTVVVPHETSSDAEI